MMLVNDVIASTKTHINGVFSIDEIKLFPILFADDQVLFSTSPTSRQSMLNDIETYCTSWGLKINVAKTKVLIFKKSSRPTHCNFYLYNGTLEIGAPLNIWVYISLKMETGIGRKSVLPNMLPKQCTVVFPVFHQYEFKTSDKCKLLDALVSPVLTYTSDIWGMNMAKDTEEIDSKTKRKSTKYLN